MDTHLEDLRKGYLNICRDMMSLATRLEYLEEKKKDVHSLRLDERQRTQERVLKTVRHKQRSQARTAHQ